MRGVRRLSGQSVLSVESPYSGAMVTQVSLWEYSRAAMAVDHSFHTFDREWRHTSLSQRIDVCRKALEYFEKNKESIAEGLSLQMGKPKTQAVGEINTMIDRANTMIQFAPRSLQDIVFDSVKNGERTLYKKIVKEPIGPVLILSPWNYPYICTINTLIPALLAGNSVLVKHSDRTSLCSNMFQRAFEFAGAPKNLVTSLPISHEIVHQIIQIPNIAHVAFTGSVSGGLAVYQSVSKRFIDCGLELGGKDPAYVDSSCDVDSAATGLVDGAMYNAGQSCCAIERVYVHEGIYDQFVESCVSISNDYVLGNPLEMSTTMGPIAQSHHIRFLESQIEQAVDFGAKVLIGGKSCKDESGKGRFFQPTVLVNCNHNMSVMMDETFGPILPIMKVASEQEAIEKMNDSSYGLTAAVYTNDRSQAERMAEQLNAGTIFMNRCDFVDPYLAWSGRKESGKGISLSPLGFNSLIRTKSYNFRV